MPYFSDPLASTCPERKTLFIICKAFLHFFLLLTFTLVTWSLLETQNVRQILTKLRSGVWLCLVHSPWKSWNDREKSTMFYWRSFFPPPSPFIATLSCSQTRSGQSHDLNSVRLAFKTYSLHLPLSGIALAPHYIVSLSTYGVRHSRESSQCNCERLELLQTLVLNPLFGKVLKKIHLLCSNVIASLRRSLLVDALLETS